MSLDDLLKGLREEYINELPEKINHIKSLAEKVAPNTNELCDEFHKLKGSGKTYGLPEVSELGYKMENFFKSDPKVGLTHVNAALVELGKIHKCRKDGLAYNLSKTWPLTAS